MNSRTSERTVDVNSRSSIVNAMLLTIVGNQLLLVAPAYVQGLVSYRAFTEVQAGFITSAEMMGLAFATVVFSLISKRFDWRWAMRMFLMLVVAGNLLSSIARSYEGYLVLRFVCGVGAGGVLAICYAVIGLTSTPERNYGYMFAVAMLYAAVVLFAMPTLYDWFGFMGILILFAGLPLFPLFLTKSLPRAGKEHLQSDEGAIEIGRYYRLSALCSLFIFFLANTGAWTYVSLIGISKGLSEQMVANGLTLAQFGGIVGGLTVGLMVLHFGRVRPLLLSFSALIIPLLFLIYDLTAPSYAVILVLFTFGWAVGHPLILGAMASIDISGRLIFFAVAVQSLGLSIGPGAAAMLISDGVYDNIIWISAGLLSISLLLVLVPVIRHGWQSRLRN